MTANGQSKLVVVTVGGDHHPFDRLVEWIDDWLLTTADRPVSCVFQYGTARRPRYAQGHAYLSHDQLQRLFACADVVVSSGGPSTLTEARRHGHTPIAVPRRHALGEHVDDHQLAFTSRLAAAGMVAVTSTREQLWEALDRGIVTGVQRDRPATIDLSAGQRSVGRVASLLNGLV